MRKSLILAASATLTLLGSSATFAQTSPDSVPAQKQCSGLAGDALDSCLKAAPGRSGDAASRAGERTPGNSENAASRSGTPPGRDLDNLSSPSRGGMESKGGQAKR
jgi:hypothetical protein